MKCNSGLFGRNSTEIFVEGFEWCSEVENLARRLAALYPQEIISEAVIDAELSQPAKLSTADEPVAAEGLAATVERHLTAYFSTFGDGLPPPGLYHRILREIDTSG